MSGGRSGRRRSGRRDLAMTLAARLRKLRIERKVSQRALAEAIGVAERSMWSYENAESLPDPDILCRLGDYYQTSTDFILGRDDRPILVS